MFSDLISNHRLKRKNLSLNTKWKIYFKIVAVFRFFLDKRVKTEQLHQVPNISVNLTASMIFTIFCASIYGYIDYKTKICISYNNTIYKNVLRIMISKCLYKVHIIYTYNETDYVASVCLFLQLNWNHVEISAQISKGFSLLCFLKSWVTSTLFLSQMVNENRSNRNIGIIIKYYSWTHSTRKHGRSV